MRAFVAVLATLILASCGGGGSPSGSSGGTTAVTVSLGGVAAGALQPAGVIPANVVRAAVDAVDANGQVIVSPPVVLDAANNFTAVVTVPNGRGIRMRVAAFDAAGARVYQGISAPQDLIGLPVTVPVKMNLVIAVTASAASVFRGGAVSLTATAAGAPPTANSPLKWGASGGTVTKAAVDPYGGQAVWTAPNALGAYDIYAKVDPAVNPDQDPNVFGQVRVQVVNRNPVAAADAAVTQAFQPVTVNVLANDSDPDGDALTLQSVTQPANGAASVVGGQVQYVPNNGFTGTDVFSYTISDGFGGTATGQVTVTVNAVPVDIAVAKAAGNAAPASGTTVTWTLTATNNAAVSVPGVRVKDALPAGLQFVSATPAGVYDPATGVWTVGALVAGAAKTLSIVTRVLPGNAGVAIANTASLLSVAAGYVDNVAGNNAATASVTPVANADLALTMTLAGGNQPGATVNYALTVTNNGPDALPAGGATVTDALPAGVTYASDTGGAATAVAANTVTWTVPALAAGASATLTISATVGQAASGTVVTNTAQVAAAVDPNPGNDLANAAFTVANVLPVISAPAVNPYGFTMLEDGGTVNLQLVATDANGDPLSYGPASGATKGQPLVSPNLATGGAVVSYTPYANLNGTDSFTVPVSDGYGQTTLTVNVSITPVNDAPVVQTNLPIAVYAGAAAVTVGLAKLRTTDVDNTPSQLVYTVTVLPAAGSLRLNGVPLGLNGTFTQADVDAGLVSYLPPLPPAAGAGLGSFGFTVTDGVIATPIPGSFTIDVLSPGKLIHVDPATGLDTYSGLSWASPYATLAQALTVAQPFDTIKLAASLDPTVYNPATPWTMQTGADIYASVTITTPDLTLSGGWIPATDTRTWNPAVPFTAGPTVSLSLLAPDPAVDPTGSTLPVLNIQASGVVLENVVTGGGSDGILVAGGASGVALVSSGAERAAGSGLNVGGAGTVVDVQGGYFFSNNFGVSVHDDGVVNVVGSLVHDNYSAGIGVDRAAGASAYASIVQSRVQANGKGVYVANAGAVADIADSLFIDNYTGVIFDLGSSGTMLRTSVTGSMGDALVNYPGNGCGVAVVGGAGPAASPVAISNALLAGNTTCGLAVDAGSVVQADHLSVMHNAGDPANPNALGGLAVAASGSLTIARSIAAYNAPAQDVYAVAGAVLTWADNNIVMDGSATGAGIVNGDPYTLPLVFDQYGNVDQYASFLPYLSQPTAPYPASPAVNGGAVSALVAGMDAYTTDIYGAVDAGQADLGFHFIAPDLDQDMIPDNWENDPYGVPGFATNPAAWDSDGDGWSDGYEVFFGGSDPVDPASTPMLQSGGVPAPAGFVQSVTASPSVQYDPYGVINLYATVVDAVSNLPVAGVPVSFAVVGSPYANFGGAQAISVLSDPAGNVVVPLSDGYAESFFVDVYADPQKIDLVTLPVAFATNAPPPVGPGGTTITAASGLGNISGANCNSHWTLAGSPYVVNAPVTVAAGCALAIDPYVVVAFAPGVSMDVYGALDVYASSGFGGGAMFTVPTDVQIGGPGVTLPGDYWGQLLVSGAGATANLNDLQLSYAGAVGNAAIELDAGATMSANWLFVDVVKSTASGIGVSGGATLTGANVHVTTSSLPALDVPLLGVTAGTSTAHLIGGTLTNLGGSAVDVGLSTTARGVVNLDGVVIERSAQGIRMLTGSSGWITNSIIRGTNRAIEILPGTGAWDIYTNAIVDNPAGSFPGEGVRIGTTATGAGGIGSITIQHNIIRDNGDSAIAVYELSGAPVDVRVNNNLIVGNGGNLAKPAVLVSTQTPGSPPAAGNRVLLQSNTVAENTGLGLQVDAYANAEAWLNLLAFNAGGDVSVHPLAVTSGTWNLRSDANPPVLPGAANDVYGNPLFVENWYLSNAAAGQAATSPAVDAYAAAALPPYLTPASTTRTDGVADTAALLDIGAHWDGPAPTVDLIQSSLVTFLPAGAGQPAMVEIRPKDAAGNLLGAGLRVEASFATTPGTLTSATGAAIQKVRDQGDGIYLVDVLSGAAGATDVVHVFVNGRLLNATSTITW